MTNYFLCPNCEARVRAGALACPQCGADEQAGWSSEPDEELLLPREALSARRRRKSPGEAGAGDEADSWLQPDGSGAAPHRWLSRIIVAVLLITLASFLIPRGRWGLYLLPLLVLGLGLLYYFTQLRSRRGSHEEKGRYDALLSRAQGDHELVERLIDYERRRNPAAGRAQHMRDALYRWNRDRR